MSGYLKKVKMLCLEKNISMTELALKLGISRRWLYKKISKEDNEFYKKIEEIFK